MKTTRCSNFIISFLLSFAAAEKPQQNCVGLGCRSPFRIIIDGGSTGSRLHIFEFVSNSTSADDDVEIIDDEIACVRRGSIRADVPMSAFARKTPKELEDRIVPSSVAVHMVPLFDYAATVIPNAYHATTEVRYAATAGMRLVEGVEQDAVYDALYEGLLSSVLPSSGENFPFHSLRRKDIATLSGKLEGFYGAVAANYLSGTIDVNLRAKTNDSHDGPLGAMDMGGSSTQLVFLPSVLNLRTSNAPLDEKDFYSHSYLSYGVDQVRENIWNMWMEEHDQSPQTSIANPCAFKGLKIKWKGQLFVGTGDAATCSSQISFLLPSLDHKVDIDLEERVVGGVQHPPIRGKFLAMSLYFFVLDFLRVMVPSSALTESWPSPTLEELSQALPGLCSRQWEGDLEFYQQSTHKFTRPEILPHRCFEAVYLVSLLRDGFGFDPKARDVSFIFDIDGSEVEWTLGMALLSHSATKPLAIKGEEGEISSAIPEVVAQVQTEPSLTTPVGL